jgi:hypothetical protein
MRKNAFNLGKIALWVTHYAVDDLHFELSTDERGVTKQSVDGLAHDAFGRVFDWDNAHELRGPRDPFEYGRLREFREVLRLLAKELPRCGVSVGIFRPEV